MRVSRASRAGAYVALVTLTLAGCHDSLLSGTTGTGPTANPGPAAYGARTPAASTRPSAPSAHVAAPAAGSIEGTPPPATAREIPIFRDDAARSGRGEIDLRVENLWVEEDITYARVSVRNTSPYELEEITIKCKAFGQGLVNLDFAEQTLLTREEERMLPGFHTTMKIRLQRGGFAVREITCSARGW
jgi:hypothetical protein